MVWYIVQTAGVLRKLKRVFRRKRTMIKHFMRTIYSLHASSPLRVGVGRFGLDGRGEFLWTIYRLHATHPRLWKSRWFVPNERLRTCLRTIYSLRAEFPTFCGAGEERSGWESREIACGLYIVFVQVRSRMWGGSGACGESLLEDYI